MIRLLAALVGVAWLALVFVSFRRGRRHPGQSLLDRVVRSLVRDLRARP